MSKLIDKRARDFVDFRIGNGWSTKGDNWLPPYCHDQRVAEAEASFKAGWRAAVEELKKELKLMADVSVHEVAFAFDNAINELKDFGEQGGGMITSDIDRLLIAQPGVKKIAVTNDLYNQIVSELIVHSRYGVNGEATATHIGGPLIYRGCEIWRVDEAPKASMISDCGVLGSFVETEK